MLHDVSVRHPREDLSGYTIRWKLPRGPCADTPCMFGCVRVCPGWVGGIIRRGRDGGRTCSRTSRTSRNICTRTSQGIPGAALLLKAHAPKREARHSRENGMLEDVITFSMESIDIIDVCMC